MHRTPERFDELLAQWRAAAPTDRPAVERQLREEFEEELATLVIDMSGFARQVIKEGIVPFLARMNAMRAIAGPANERLGGSVIKFVGDDVLAVMPDSDLAVQVSEEILAASDVHSEAHPELAFHLCVGIGYGPILHVPGEDVWGDEVNRAFKLGEEIGNATDIQLTKRAFGALRGDQSRFESTLHTVSGVVLEAYSLRAPG
jgi:class 3 adenylate cyclase